MRTLKNPSLEEAHVIAVVARNLRNLLDSNKWSEHDLSKRSGVSQKAINNLLNQANGCTITTAHKLAAPFGLQGWQLMLEHLPSDLTVGSTLTQVVDKLIATDHEGREFIRDAADRT